MKQNHKALKYLLCSILIATGVDVSSQSPLLFYDAKDIGCDPSSQVKKSDRVIHTGEENMMMGGITPTIPLAWPLKMSETYESTTGVYSYWYISNFADLNSTEGVREDWMCFTGSSAKNYDQHNGVDIVPYPFPWQMMDDESVDIVAAADGEVIWTYDANTVDRNCASPHSFNFFEFNSGYYGNFVALEHSDGTVTIYGHMKNGTVAVEDGDQVVQGQKLGKIGSSGNSTAPHLHFEVRMCEGCSYFEPWYDAAGCNDDIDASWWISQIPYNEPQVLRVSTHTGTPVNKTCTDYEAGANEDVFLANHFSAAGNLYISVAMRDYLIGDAISVDIINQAGTVVESFSHSALSNYQSVNIYFTEGLVGYASGTYRIRVTHDSKTYDHFFTVNCTSTYTLSGAHTGHKAWIAGDNINSTATISGVSTNIVLYEAENYVKLNVGFKATQNCEFRAQIDDCTVLGTKTAEEELLDEPQSNTVLLYPNPTFGAFDIVYFEDDPFESEIIIRDQMGRIIYTSGALGSNSYIKEHIDLGNFPKGIYYAELRHGAEIEILPVVVQ